MASFRSIRTWLAATLVIASVLTAGVIALYVVPTADREYRTLAQDAVLGVSARAAHDVRALADRGQIDQALARASRDGQLSLWLVDHNRHVIAASALPSVDCARLPDEAAAVKVALSGHRFVPPGDANASHVDRPAEPGCRRACASRSSPTRRARASPRARAMRCAAGCCSAPARRDRRAASRASSSRASSPGACDGSRAAPSRSPAATSTSRVRDGFPDEIGPLAGSIDEMRERLAVAFAELERERERARGACSTGSRRASSRSTPTGVVEVFNPAAGKLLGVPIERGRPLPDPWPATPSSGCAGDAAPTPTRSRRRTGATCASSARRSAPTDATARASSCSRIARPSASARRRSGASSRTPRTSCARRSRPSWRPSRCSQDGAKDEPAARDAFLADVQHEAHRLAAAHRRAADAGAAGRRRAAPARCRTSRSRPRLAHVAELMRPLADAGGVTIDAARDAAAAAADPDILDQVLVGLVGNALKHTPRRRHRRRSPLRTARDDARVDGRRHGPRHPAGSAGPGVRPLLARRLGPPGRRVRPRPRHLPRVRRGDGRGDRAGIHARRRHDRRDRPRGKPRSSRRGGTDDGSAHPARRRRAGADPLRDLRARARGLRGRRRRRTAATALERARAASTTSRSSTS